MLRSIITLDIPSTIVSELCKKGFIYVEDLLNNLEHLEKYNLNKSMLEKQLQLSENLALDVWQNDAQQKNLSICCTDLEAVFESNIHCGIISELSGAPFSGKTQICMQLCVAVQLDKCYGGLNGRAIYIDTRCGTSFLRFEGKTILYIIVKYILYLIGR